MDIVLRQAQNGDLAPLIELAQSSFTATFTAHNTAENMARYVDEAFAPAVMSREFEDAANSFIVAEIVAKAGEQLAGYAKLRRGSQEPCIVAEHHIELERLYTATALIGRGVGAQLLQAAVDLAEQENRQVIWLGVWEHNSDAIRFYRRQGFVDVGSHAFMLGNDRQLDRIMQLDLTTRKEFST